jgi:quercetin dioxygenase-like cupin family protein
MSESEGHAYLRDHQLQGEALRLNLNEVSAELLNEAKGSSVGRAARTLVKEGPLRLTMLALRQDGAIDEHRAGGLVSIEVINDGDVTIEVSGKSHRLVERETLVLEADVPHSLRAQRDTVMLLTIAMANAN